LNHTTSALLRERGNVDLTKAGAFVYLPSAFLNDGLKRLLALPPVQHQIYRFFNRQI
jgi:hypothetical protein